VLLPGGRLLGYAEFGQPDGYPVIYFHGAPSSRLEPMLVGDEAWTHAGLRVIAPDRPGMGRSDFQTNRRFTHWPHDVVALADALELDRFAVLGMSGGGAYVAVCAAKIPERLSAAVIVSGGWPMRWPNARRGLPVPNQVTWILATRAPVLLHPLLMAMRAGSKSNEERELRQLAARVPPADYAAFREPGRWRAFAESLRESMRQGTRGPAWDLRLYGRDFGFKFDEVRVPITLFHGEQDANVPIALAHRGAAHLPGAKLITYPDDAHLSTLCNHVEEIAEVLNRFSSGPRPKALGPS
jgi:pimeloyl-ACP methyl ester carboxylesterase